MYLILGGGLGQSVPKPSPLGRCPEASKGVAVLRRPLTRPFSVSRGLMLPWPDLDAAGFVRILASGSHGGAQTAVDVLDRTDRSSLPLRSVMSACTFAVVSSSVVACVRAMLI